jgi:hypothetical protein
MATVNKWANVSIVFQSAAAATKTITNITKGTTCTVSSTAHGYANGDYVLLLVNGMFQMSNKVIRVSSIAADTYVAEGIDSTLFDTFSTGTGQKLTFGNSITTAVTMTSGGGDFPFIDTTTIHSNIKTSVPGTPNAQTYTFDNLWDPADSGQIAMKVASDSQAQRAFKFTFGSGGPIMVFTGYVGFAGAPGGTAQDKVTTSAAITAFGTPTYYAS